MSPEPTHSSEYSRRGFLRVGAAAATTGAIASSAFLAACGKSKKDSGAADAVGSDSKDALKVGVVAPFSGVGAFIGTIVTNSLEAAVKELNSTGGIGGRKVQLLLRDTGVDSAAGPRVYTSLLSEDVIGIVWCAGAGFNQTLAQIKRDGMPVVAAFNDPYSPGYLYPEGDRTGRSVFQLGVPTKFGMEVLGAYATQDRGYTSAALIADTTLDAEGNTKKYFDDACKRLGVQNKGVETFSIPDSDYGPQLQRLKAAKPQSLWVWGLAGNTAGIVRQLADLGASYIDTPTAKNGPDWHPHIFGSPAGTGDKTWVELAKDAAKVGTVTAWHVGGLVYLPTFKMGKWMQKYLKKDPTGGEELPADGLATLLEAVKKAGSTDRAKIVDAIETMGKITFASVPFSFTKDRHVSQTKDDIIIVGMERSDGSAKYKLGKEWDEGFTKTPAGPTQLVDFTLEANKRAHPDVMKQVIEGGYGTYCGGQADEAAKEACKKLH